MTFSRQVSSTRKAVLAVGAVTLLAGALRFHALSRPPEKVFDETYYASDGCWYAGEPYQECDLEDDGEKSWVHPPLGKQIISVGINAFGNRPFGWRVMSALAGTATVALVGVLAFLLFGSWLWAAVAALLAGTEHLLFVQSRIAMLDVFVALFVVLGFTLLVADRRRDPPPDTPRDPEPDGSPSAEGVAAEGIPPPPLPEPPRRWIRPLYVAAGAAFGAAIAAKWSGYLALLGGAGLAVAWTTRRIRDLGARTTEFVGLGVSFVVVPFLVYAATWIPWLAERGFDIGEWFGHQDDMLAYHRNLQTVQENGDPIHPYMSRAAGWLLLLRPVAYHWRGDPDCCAEILGIGNPALFWGALLFLPYLVLVWVSRKEWQAGPILVAIVAQLLPWLVVARPLFLFYMTPITPFLALGMVYPLRDLFRTGLDRRLASAAAVLVVAVCVGLFAFFWPVLAASPLTYDEWQARIWFDSWV